MEIYFIPGLTNNCQVAFDYQAIIPGASKRFFYCINVRNNGKLGMR